MARHSYFAITIVLTNGRWEVSTLARALMSRPSIELISVDAHAIHEAERLMESCQQCRPSDAYIPFDWLLGEVTGKHGKYDFVMAELARCPNCNQPVTEGTLVEPKD
jgi:hypothetical protein